MLVKHGHLTFLVAGQGAIASCDYSAGVCQNLDRRQLSCFALRLALLHSASTCTTRKHVGVVTLNGFSGSGDFGQGGLLQLCQTVNCLFLAASSNAKSTPTHQLPSMASRRSATGGLACKAFDKAHLTAYGHLFNNEAQALRRLTVVDVPRVVKLSAVLRLKAEGIGWIVME